MLDMLSHLTPNPGHYVYDGPVTPFVIAGSGLALAIFFIIAAVTSRSETMLIVGTVAAVAACVAAGMLAPRFAGDPDDWTATDEYYATVITWLDTDYGIDVDADAAAALSRGGELAVDYDGAQVLIELVDAADGDIAVRTTSGELLAPLSAGK